ncbi:unnamed protein product [Protopolystoma xenopodis]|uniref:RRM domain-containing protein n=1 Tax=Protopolystoma xenopodis TaxID=117903 RepID=A0A3S5B9Y8_9PLAT|nr:unnamed protein product [Protopolystoma xenopodis]
MGASATWQRQLGTHDQIALYCSMGTFASRRHRVHLAHGEFLRCSLPIYKRKSVMHTLAEHGENRTKRAGSRSGRPARPKTQQPSLYETKAMDWTTSSLAALAWGGVFAETMLFVKINCIQFLFFSLKSASIFVKPCRESFVLTCPSVVCLTHSFMVPIICLFLSPFQVSLARPSCESIKGANLYICGLPKTVGQKELERLFGQCGKIITSRILMEPNTGELGMCVWHDVLVEQHFNLPTASG